MDFSTHWQYADVITKSLFYILMALSVLTWVVGLLRIYQSYRLQKRVKKELTEQFNFISKTIEPLSISERKLAVEQLFLRSIAQYRYTAERGMSILGTTAAIAPFIGLFGTVWGIFHALHAIGETGQAGLNQVAGPVGEALIMTGFGLAVAIPAVIFYNISMRFNRHIMYVAHDNAYHLLGNTISSRVTY